MVSVVGSVPGYGAKWLAVAVEHLWVKGVLQGQETHSETHVQVERCTSALERWTAVCCLISGQKWLIESFTSKRVHLLSGFFGSTLQLPAAMS